VIVRAGKVKWLVRKIGDLPGTTDQVTKRPNVSIVVVSYNTRDLLEQCLRSVTEKTPDEACEMFVVDNASHDGSYEMVRRLFPDVRAIRNTANRGFAAANNQAIAEAHGEYIVLLNSDTVLENNVVSLLRDFMQSHPTAGVCGPLLLNADKSVQRSIDSHPTVASAVIRLLAGARNNPRRQLSGDRYHPNVFDYSRVQRVVGGWLTGAVLMIRRSVFSDVGLLDENYQFMLEDADWGLAVSRTAWETWFVPDAVVTHLLGASRKALPNEQQLALKVAYLRQQEYYFRKNAGFARAAGYRSVAVCVHMANLVLRSAALAITPRKLRAQALSKKRLAWRLLLASAGIDGDARSGDRLW
jgi:GT2 family glycosyltransferase